MFGVLKNPRLGQWNGQRYWARHRESLGQRLQHRAVILRLTLVWLTTLATTWLAYWWGPPLPYREGEVYSYDIRTRVDFELVNHVELINQQDDFERETSSEIREKAQPSDRPVVEKYPRGLMLVPRGQPIQERQLDLLQEEHRAFLESMTRTQHLARGIGMFLTFTLLATLVVLYVARFQPGLASSLSKIAGVCLLALLTLFLGLVLHRPPWYAVLVPSTLTAMIFTLVYNPQFALLITSSLALALTVLLGTQMDHLLVHMAGLAGAVLLLRNVRTRTQLVQVAAGAGLAFFVMTFATGLLSGQTMSLILADGLRRFFWGCLAGFLLTGLLPLVERAFGFVSDISLLELVDGSHPLLRELVRRAPGTYTHSMTVATLAEGAAEAIEANPLLTRVGCHFHDIGKMLKPHYFIENQTGENRHDQLEPALSTLVIIGHVKDGIALARQYRLPRPILDCIAQHHGTTLIEFFYREAMRLQENQGNAGAELEASFRYPGPKPQNREIGILMLADAVESSSRTLVHPTPASLSKLVHDLLMKRLLDGQFEESGLTLTELRRIEESISKSLIALFHARIQYPEQPPQAKAS